MGGRLTDSNIFLYRQKNYKIWDFSKLREPILECGSAKWREKYVLSRGDVFVVFSTSAFWTILKNQYFQLEYKDLLVLHLFNFIVNLLVWGMLGCENVICFFSKRFYNVPRARNIIFTWIQNRARALKDRDRCYLFKRAPDELVPDFARRCVFFGFRILNAQNVSKTR